MQWSKMKLMRETCVNEQFTVSRVHFLESTDLCNGSFRIPTRHMRWACSRRGRADKLEMKLQWKFMRQVLELFKFHQCIGLPDPKFAKFMHNLVMEGKGARFSKKGILGRRSSFRLAEDELEEEQNAANEQAPKACKEVAKIKTEARRLVLCFAALARSSDWKLWEGDKVGTYLFHGKLCIHLPFQKCKSQYEKWGIFSVESSRLPSSDLSVTRHDGAPISENLFLPNVLVENIRAVIFHVAMPLRGFLTDLFHGRWCIHSPFQDANHKRRSGEIYRLDTRKTGIPCKCGS